MRGDETATLIGALERNRRTFAWKCGDLGSDELRRTLMPVNRRFPLDGPSLARQIRFPTEPDQHPSPRKSRGGEKEVKRARSHKRDPGTKRAAKSHAR